MLERFFRDRQYVDRLRRGALGDALDDVATFLHAFDTHLDHACGAAPATRRLYARHCPASSPISNSARC